VIEATRSLSQGKSWAGLVTEHGITTAVSSFLQERTIISRDSVSNTKVLLIYDFLFVNDSYDPTQ
jgi:hypothetical protein